jgi:phosphohistidine phosphatase
MRLILIRHGKAEDREAFAKEGEDDSQRPLTPAGKRQMKRAAKGLRRLVGKIDLMATSPLKRAVQTAGIVYDAFDGKPEFLELDLLSGDGQDPAKFVAWLKQHDLDGPETTVAIVGHEPDLGRWASWLASGQKKGFIELKKGAVCVIEFAKTVGGGKGRVCGVFQAGDLRRVK